MNTELTEKVKDHFQLKINNIDVGVFERSQLRQLIEDIDNQIP